jgi:FSR family fosmidomycin resistance protein-like MFS transporter
MNIGISMGKGFTQFLGLSILAGIGSSAQHPIGASIISNGSHPSEKGKMLGLNQSIPAIAFTFTPLLTAYLLTKMGWRSTLGILSLPAASLSLFVFFFIRGNSYIEGRTRDGLNLSKLRQQLGNRNVLSISILRSVMAFRMGVRTFLPLYFIDSLGVTPQKSSILYSILLAGGVVGPFFWGWLSDRVNRKPLIIVVMAASAIGYFMLNYITNFLSLALLLFFIGFMVQTVIIQSVLTDTVDQSQLDQIFGLYFTIGFTIASFSSAIFGWIVETFNFGIGFSYITVVSLISLISALFIKEPRNIAS